MYSEDQHVKRTETVLLLVEMVEAGMRRTQNPV